MVKRILIFLSIITVFSIFSSREPNYDDIIYIQNGEYIAQNGVNDFLQRDWPFHGTKVRLTEGTHSIAPLLFYALLMKIKMPLFAVHLLLYAIYASILFFTEGILKKTNSKHTLYLSLFFLLSPAVSVYANSFMTDIPAFALSTAALFFLAKHFEGKNAIFLILFFLFSLFGVLFSYTSFILFAATLALFDESRSRRGLIIIFAGVFISLSATVLLNAFGYAPSVLRSLSWFGSERVFNYHKTLEKAMGLLVWTGLFFLPCLAVFDVRKKIRSSLILLVSALLFEIYFRAFSSAVSRVIFGVLLFSGVSALFSVFGRENGIFKPLFAVAAGAAVVIAFPMAIGRYLLFFFFASMPLVLRNANLKRFSVFLSLSAAISVILLFSDTIQSKSYGKMNFTEPFAESRFSLDAKRRFFLGEWGYRYQAERNGITPLVIEKNIMRENDILFVPMLENMADIRKLAPHLSFTERDSAFSFPVKLLSKESSSGYYTSMYGILPFSVSGEYSVKQFVYRYKENAEPNFVSYASEVAFWNGEPVIPSHVNDTITLMLRENDELFVVFFPDRRVERSDGIEVRTVMQREDGMLELFGFTGESKGGRIFTIKERGVYKLTFSPKKSEEYDWFGISIKPGE